MARPTNLSQIISAVYGGDTHPPIHYQKRRRFSGALPVAASGFFNSLWLMDGGPTGVAPTSAAACSASTQGALPIPTTVSGSNRLYLVNHEVEHTLAVQARVVLYDRLLACGGFDSTVASPTLHTVGGTLTRHTSGHGNFMFLEWYANTGATPVNVEVLYTNQDGTSGRSSILTGLFSAVDYRSTSKILLVPLQAGDTGVRSVQSVELSASTGTAGNFGITIGRVIGSTSFTRSNGILMDSDFTAGPSILPDITDACLALLAQGSGSWLPDVTGTLGILEA